MDITKSINPGNGPASNAAGQQRENRKNESAKKQTARKLRFHRGSPYNLRSNQRQGVSTVSHTGGNRPLLRTHQQVSKVKPSLHINSANQFLNLPNELLFKVCSYLSLNDVNNLTNTCKSLYKSDLNIEYLNQWFSRLPQHLQTQYQNIAKKISEPGLEARVRQFLDNEEQAKSLLNIKTANYFPQALFYTLYQLRANCPGINAVQEAEFSFGTDLISSATFSPDGLHIALGNIYTTKKNGQLFILSLDTDGQWGKSDHDLKRPNLHATFSPESNKLLIITKENGVIAFSLDTDRNWKHARTSKQHTFAIKDRLNHNVIIFSSNGKYLQFNCHRPIIWHLLENMKYKFVNIPRAVHNGVCLFTTLSPDGRLLLSTYQDNTIEIFSMDTDGQAKSAALIPHTAHRDNVGRVVNAFFNADNRYMVVNYINDGFNQGSALFGLGADGNWQAIANMPVSFNSRDAAFSPDGSHVAHTMGMNSDWLINIYSRDENWVKKTTLRHPSNIKCFTFSSDGRYLATVITSGSEPVGSTIFIYHRDANRGWMKITAISKPGTVIEVITFSADGLRLLAAGSTTATIWSLIPKKDGTESFARGQDGQCP